MVFDLFSCTFDTLNNLKFNELQKLAIQFQVNKRWAKKREIIEKLLLLRDQEKEKQNPPENKSPQNMQWTDGSKALLLAEHIHEEPEDDRRLTYNVNNSFPQKTTDRRLTFTISKGDENKIPLSSLVGIPENIDRRLTYKADDLKFKLNNPTRRGPGFNKLTKDINQCNGRDDNAATEENLTLNQGKHMIINDKKTNYQTKSTTEQSKVKMLTIPYEGRLGENRKTSLKVTKIKLPEKIQESTKVTGKPKNPDTYKTTNLTTPLDFKSSTKPSSLSMQKKNLLQKSTTKPDISMLDLKQVSPPDKHRTILPRRKSKTEDNVLVKNLKASASIKFFSPKESCMRTSRSHSQSPQSLESKIPKLKSGHPTLKPITATKMPDFSKIHQKQFEQMDSLHDYVRKKEERARKLFGVSQPTIPIKINKDIFQFKSSNNVKKIELNISIKNSIPPHLRAEKEKTSRKDVLNRPGTKTNIMMSLKEQNRKHISGVRTNKRFELLMKQRNL